MHKILKIFIFPLNEEIIHFKNIKLLNLSTDIFLFSLFKNSKTLETA